jgi:uncharacterized membrane protein YgcG
MKAILTGLALLLLALPAQAQTADARWQPWLGCWELTADNVREGAPAARRLADGSPTARRSGDSIPRVCVSAAGGGARFETTVRGQAAVDQTIVADAVQRPLNDAECQGTQHAEWSRDGLRLFSRATLTCKDDAAQRVVSGLSMLAPNGSWLDIQAVEIGSRETVRVRRYYRAAGEPAVSRAVVAASSLTLDDVKEASAKVAPRALEAALVETDAGFDLKAGHLVDLDKAGVPDSVIDLMVALSYPERFVVERPSRRGGGGGGTFINDPFLLGWSFGYPVFYDAYSPFYYTPFGYSRYSFGGGYIADGIAFISAPTEPQPSGAGRVVDGQGYTRIRPREAAAAENGQTGTRSNRAISRTPGTPIDSSSSSSTASSSGGSSTSSGGSSTSSGGGYSAGSSSGDTGRTAQPR